jgi:hypothetical protein
VRSNRRAARRAARHLAVQPVTHDEFLVRAEQEISRRQQQDAEIDRKVIMPGKSSERLAGAIEVGDRVWVASLQASGDVLELHERDGEADVQLEISACACH